MRWKGVCVCFSRENDRFIGIFNDLWFLRAYVVYLYRGYVVFSGGDARSGSGNSRNVLAANLTAFSLQPKHLFRMNDEVTMNNKNEK